MCALDIKELLLQYTIGKNLHFNPIRSSFVIVVPFNPHFNSNHKNAFHWEPRNVLHMLYKKFSYGKNTHFCAYFERCTLSPKIHAKRVRVIIDKMCVLKIKDTLLFSSICKKCQDSQ